MVFIIFPPKLWDEILFLHHVLYRTDVNESVWKIKQKINWKEYRLQVSAAVCMIRLVS